MKIRAILRVMSRMREMHPEMRVPITWPGLKAVIEREGVSLRTAPIDCPAYLIGYRGRWAIILNNDEPKRRWPYFAAHELGHLKLHVDSQGDRFEPCYYMETDWQNDPREDDAEFFATAVLTGPRHVEGP